MNVNEYPEKLVETIDLIIEWNKPDSEHEIIASS